MKRQSSCSGCWTFLLILFALGLMISAWQSSGVGLRVLLVAVTLAVIVGAAFIIDRKEKGPKTAPTPPRPETPKAPGGWRPPVSESGPVTDPWGGWPGPPMPPPVKVPIGRPQKPQKPPTERAEPGQRNRKRGRSAPTLAPEDVAAVVDAYRRTRLQQGANPKQIDDEVRLRFGRELEQLGLDETGTPQLFGTPGGSEP